MKGERKLTLLQKRAILARRKLQGTHDIKYSNAISVISGHAHFNYTSRNENARVLRTRMNFCVYTTSLNVR